jgi:hypothetical protein
MADAEEGRTLTGVMADLTRRGFIEQFVLAGDHLRAVSNGKAFYPPDVRISEYHRFEGVSDPDDMAILYALETRTGLRGTLADAFGVYAEPGIGAFMSEVGRTR